MKDDKVYIAQILDSIKKLKSFTVEMDREKFGLDEKTQSAVIMQLLLIGEVSKKISPEVKSGIDLPWQEIAGFRNAAIHNYFEIDLDIVWETLISDIPVLEKTLLKNHDIKK
ncbi:MAG TPA: DUF86 domain-containing protein [Candidatus Paceibacterota bacterium]